MLYSSLTSFFALLLATRFSFAAPAHSGGSQIHWGPCDSSVVNDTSLECGFFDVPLDYHNHKIGKARLAVVKANATGERRGTVFFNPGGPGGSGLEALNNFKDRGLAVTGGVYDIVGWDPRAVGNLTVPGEIVCFDSVEEYTAFFNGTIESTGEIGNISDPVDVKALFSQAPIMQEKYEQVGQKCLDSPTGQFLKYIGTAAAVRDLVSLANALDGPDAPINYIGLSYGTLIGSWFVNMFPERVGRVVLDGVVDPVLFATQELSTHWITQLGSADTVYKAFITGCALTGPAGCAIASEGDGPLQVDAKIQALLKAAHDATRANPSVPLTSGAFRTLLYTQMYTPEVWPALVNEVYPQAVEIVKGETGQNASSTNGSFNVLLAGGLKFYTTMAIFCADTIDADPSINMTDIFESTIANQDVSHMFGTVWPALFSQCPFWPVRSVERYSGPFNRKLANKIIVASSLYDPVTPLRAAQVLAGSLGDDAALVQVNGFGHTASVALPSTCFVNMVSAYMINGTVPANNTMCEVDTDFEVFPGVNTAAILANLPATDI